MAQPEAGTLISLLGKDTSRPGILAVAFSQIAGTETLDRVARTARSRDALRYSTEVDVRLDPGNEDLEIKRAILATN